MTKRILWALGAVVLGASPAFAQPIVGDGYRVPPLEPSIDWMVILYFVVMCLGTAVIGFMRSNRTHLD